MRPFRDRLKPKLTEPRLLRVSALTGNDHPLRLAHSGLHNFIVRRSPCFAHALGVRPLVERPGALRPPSKDGSRIVSGGTMGWGPAPAFSHGLKAVPERLRLVRRSCCSLDRLGARSADPNYLSLSLKSNSGNPPATASRMRGSPNFHEQSLRLVSEKIGSPTPRKVRRLRRP